MPLFGPPDVAKLQARSNVKGLIKALRYMRDGGIRVEAARALGEMGDRRALAPLEMALHDPDPRVVLVAVDALRSTGRWADATAPEGHGLRALVTLYLESTQIDSPGASQADATPGAERTVDAARRLGQLGDRAAVPFLLGALLRLHEALGEPSERILDERVRSAILIALRQTTGQRYGPDPEAWMAWLDANVPLEEWQGILG